MISVIGVDDVEWNAIVRSYPRYEVFYLREYVKAFQLQDESNGEPLLIYYTNEEEFAYNVIFKRDISLDKHFQGKIPQGQYYDIISPYGYGGFIGNISNYKSLNSEYREFCENNHFICEFVRFELFGDYCSHFDGEVHSLTRNVVRSLDMPIEEIWADFKQKVRKNVKKANSNGLQCIVDKNGDYLQDFLRIYYGTMDRTEAQDTFYFSEEFFRCLLKMTDNCVLFHVLYDDKIVSTELVLVGAENCYSYLGGTDSNYFDVRPNDFLKFEIIKWAKDNGLKNFVLGGGYGSDDGIFQYKLSLAPNGIRSFFIGKRIFDEVAYSKLVRLRSEYDDTFNNESHFFPLYRS